MKNHNLCTKNCYSFYVIFLYVQYQSHGCSLNCHHWKGSYAGEKKKETEENNSLKCCYIIYYVTGLLHVNLNGPLAQNMAVLFLTLTNIRL